MNIPLCPELVEGQARSEAERSEEVFFAATGRAIFGS